MGAARQRNVKQVECLLRLGADPKAKDNDGRDSVDWATMCPQSGNDTARAAETMRLLRLPVRKTPSY